MRPSSRILLSAAFDGGGVDGIRAHALQAEENGAIGAVSAAGQCQRAVELRRHLGRARQQLARRQQLDEAARRVHRAHGV